MSIKGKRDMKIGILGGTFDPVHNGHLRKAAEAKAQVGLDQVLFMVAGDPWMKAQAGVQPTAAGHRLEMVRLAVASNDSFEADGREAARPGPTYTVDTLEELSAQDASTELYLILGSDLLKSLHCWRCPSRLLDLARILVLERPGFQTDLGILDNIRQDASARAQIVSGSPIEVSSTCLRQRTERGEPIREWVPAAVVDYIEKSELYGQ